MLVQVFLFLMCIIFKHESFLDFLPQFWTHGNAMLLFFIYIFFWEDLAALILAVGSWGCLRVVNEACHILFLFYFFAKPSKLPSLLLVPPPVGFMFGHSRVSLIAKCLNIVQIRSSLLHISHVVKHTARQVRLYITRELKHGVRFGRRCCLLF